MLRKLAKPVTGGEPAGLSLFCYIEVNTMTKKTFASFEQQIQHLEDKGIIISDRAYAEAMLKQIGYFPLIGGYKHLFRVPFTKTYKIGTTFEEIVALYEFDSDLRDLFFKYLLQIERNLRSLMSYYFTEKYGESQDAYLDSSNYNTNRRNQKVVARLISTLKYAANTTDYEFINYQRNTYGNIPLWVLVSVLTFGNLSKMYKVFPQSLQSKICKNFGIINQNRWSNFYLYLQNSEMYAPTANGSLHIAHEIRFLIYHCIVNYLSLCREASINTEKMIYLQLALLFDIYCPTKISVFSKNVWQSQ